MHKHENAHHPAVHAPLSSVPGLRSLLFSTGMAQFLMPFMMAGLNPMLPAVGHDLQASAMELGLIGAVYALSLAVFHLLAGRIGDIIGRRRLFLTGLTIFLTSAAALPLMPSAEPFLVMRFVQAMGTAMMNTSALAMLMAFTPVPMRGRVMGTAIIGTFLGVSFGPVIGGFIAQTLGWRWMFYLLLPIGITAWILMLRVHPPEEEPVSRRFDWSGSICWLLGMACLAGGAVWILNGPVAWGAIAVGFLFLGLFVFLQRRSEQREIPPILDINMALHNRPFLYSSIISFINYSTVMGPLFFFSLFLQYEYHLDMRQAGLLLGIQPFIQLVLSRSTGRLADEYGPENIYTAGLVMCMVALLLGCTFGSGTPLWMVIVTLVFMGSGMAFFGAPSTTAIMSSVDSAHMSQASGVVGTMRTTGMMISMVVVSLSTNWYLGDAPASIERLPQFISAMRVSITFFAVMNVIALVLALWLRIQQHRQGKHQHEHTAS